MRVEFDEREIAVGETVRELARCRGERGEPFREPGSQRIAGLARFIEPIGGAASHPPGMSRQGGINVVIRQQDDNLVTVLGEAPLATIRQIAHSVARR